jgi:phosphotransferase system  glucose/maltose/N-acetylglucosamine-specific IIC component
MIAHIITDIQHMVLLYQKIYKEETIMKKLNVRRMGSMFLVVMVLMAFLATPAFAEGTGTNFDTITTPIVELINSLLSPALAIVGAIGSLYCVVLGVKYAKAEEPQDREKAKGHLKSAIIGFVLIFVLMLALKLAMPILQQWVVDNSLPKETLPGA